MGRKLKKNSFLEGALFGYIAILISKVLGAVYSIPFYSIIGSRGGVIYSCAYNIYSLFLDISVSGIPIAVSIVISNYNAKGMVRSKEKTYSLTLKFMAILSFICFLIMQIFARHRRANRIRARRTSDRTFPSGFADPRHAPSRAHPQNMTNVAQNSRLHRKARSIRSAHRVSEAEKCRCWDS